MTDSRPDPEHVRRLVDQACEEDPDGLLEVVRRWPDAVRPYHRRLIDADMVYPWDLMRGMDEPTARYLVDLIERGGRRRARLLVALAMGTTATGEAALRRWTADPPQWTEELGYPWPAWPRFAGLEFGQDGAVRTLTGQEGRALVTAGPSEDAVSGGTLDRLCGWCGLPLLRLLQAGIGDGLPAAFTPADRRVTIGTCVRCGTYTIILTEFDGTFAAENQRPDYLGDDGDTWDLPSGRLKVGSPRPTAFTGTAWHAGGSTLGGAPDWIQDPEYPECPRCGRTMPFVAMVVDSDLWGDLGPGCQYLFLDAPCRLSAVVSQQS